MKLYQKIAFLLDARKNCEKSGNVEWFEKHSDALVDIERNLLPSGGGFDAGCKILMDESTENRIVIQADFHAMDDHGYYCGWKEYRVVVKPHLAYGMALRVDGRNFNMLKEYIADTFYDVLNEEC